MKVFQNTIYKTEKDWTQWNGQAQAQVSRKKQMEDQHPYKPISVAYPICLNTNLKQQLRHDSSILFKVEKYNYGGLSTDAKFSEKVTFLTPGIRNVIFSEKFVYLLNG